MNPIGRKMVWLSAMLLGAASLLVAPRMSTAQDRDQHSRSVQAAPNQNNNHQERRGDDSRGTNRGNSNQGRGRQGEPSTQGRWDMNRNRQPNNNFGQQNWDRGRDRDRNRESSDHDRHDWDRDRGHRNGNDFNLGLFYGAPYTNYYGFDQGFYATPYAAPPYAYGNSFDMGYSDGFSAGQFDRSQGNLYNPRQYERSGDPDYFEGFVAGYQDGFRR